ncbi:hypothetical protein Tco_0489185 [Tanacetum coccineum]
MVGGNGRNQFRQYAGQNVGNQNWYNAVQNVGNLVVQNTIQNPGVQNVGNQNELIVVLWIANQNENQNENGNVVATRDEVAYLQTLLVIAQKEEAGIQIQAEEFDLMAVVGDLDEIEEMDQLSVEQSGGTVEQNHATIEETRAYFKSLYNNLAIKIEKVNSVNHKMKETNAELNTELARYKNQEKYLEINREKYDKLERCYQPFVYQEQCLNKNINALHLSSAKMTTTLNEEIVNLNNQLSKEKSTISYLQQKKKQLKSDFKIREDELLDKQIQLENKIKEIDNILVKTGQSIQTMHMLSPKPDSFYHTEHKMALGYQNPFYLKQAQQKQQSLYNGKVLLEKHDHPVVYDSKETLQLAQESRIKIKQLNKEIKPINYAKINQLLEVFVSQKVKSREDLYFSNTSKTASVSKSILIPNEEFSDDTSPSVARKFLNEVKGTIVTLKQADESLTKQKALEYEIERLLRAVVCQDIMSIVQNPTVVETSDLQTELEHTKERFENCIIEKENEYTKVWNDWYKKCEECKYDKISYNKSYNDMQQKIEQLQDQLGDLKGKIKYTTCVSDTLNPLSQKLEDKNLKAQLFDKVSEQKDTTQGTSANTKFPKQSILGNPPSSSKSKLNFVTPFPNSKVFPKVGETNALLKPVTSNSALSTRESKVMKNDNVIAPGMFRINPSKTSRMTTLATLRALCYPKNDHENIGKLGVKGDIGFFIGYSATSSIYDDYIGGQSSAAPRTAPAAPAPQVL